MSIIISATVSPHGRRSSERGAREPVVVEAGERVCVCEVLEARADLGVVERERSRVAEPAGKLEVVLVEERVLPGAVDVQCALERAAGDQRNGDQSLRVRRRSGHERDAGVLVRLVREHRAAVDDRPARDPLPVRNRVGEDLLRPGAAREDGQQLAPLLVGLVDVQVVVRDEPPSVSRSLKAPRGSAPSTSWKRRPDGGTTRRARLSAPDSPGSGRGEAQRSRPTVTRISAHSPA